jgi:hypothetical protein
MNSKFGLKISKNQYEHDWQIGIDICHNSRELYLKLSLYKVAVVVGKVVK